MALAKRAVKGEQVKIAMLQQPDVDVTVIFAMFDFWKRGYFGDEEFVVGLDTIGIVPSPKELKLLQARFKLDPFAAKTISFGDFAHLIEPAVHYAIPNVF